MAGSREPGHVGAVLGDDDLGGAIADAGDGAEAVTGPAERDGDGLTAFGFGSSMTVSI